MLVLQADTKSRRCRVQSMDELPATALVIRGGLFPEVDDVRVVLQDAIDDGYGAVLSVHIAAARVDQATEDTLRALAVEAGIPNGKIRVTTVGRLLDAGLGIIHDVSEGQPECHYH